MIKLTDVSRLYPAKAEGDGGAIRALDNFSLSVDGGEWIAIMGPSGSGKSTLVNLIGCLDRPTSGEIWLDGENVASLSAAAVTAFATSPASAGVQSTLACRRAKSSKPPKGWNEAEGA